jgi:hypothetical protein
MPLYYFDLYDGGGGIADPDGTHLADGTAAYVHACRVVGELLSNAEPRTRHCLLQVRDEDGNCLSVLPFVAFDRTLDHLAPQTRRLIEEACEKRRALAAAMFEARVTMRRTRALVARSRGRPRLATERGRLI